MDESKNLSKVPGMVRARNPQRIKPAQTFITHQNVLHGVVHGMSHVQLTSYIWRWHHDSGRVSPLQRRVLFCLWTGKNKGGTTEAALSSFWGRGRFLFYCRSVSFYTIAHSPIDCQVLLHQGFLQIADVHLFCHIFLKK